MNNKIPALRISLATVCNLSCAYCPPNGENYAFSGKPLSTPKILKILRVLHKIGFRHFGFTGGEPLLNKRLPIIIQECAKFKCVHLKLYTNGLLLKEKMEVAKRCEVVKLSLDTLNCGNYKKITGKNALLKVLIGIESAKVNNVRVRINTVLTKCNYDEIFNIIDYCRKKEIDIKILDLNCFSSPGYSAWKTLYRSPVEIEHSLEARGLKKRVIYTTGQYGVAMSEYRWGNSKIRIKDTNAEAVYAPICRNCRYFLCQEGLYQLTLTCDGKLKMCRHRSDISVDIGRRENDSDMANSIMKFLSENYFLAQRVQKIKQVFLGRFGKNAFPQIKSS